MFIKESNEWITSWTDHSEKSDLPRVLLVGDSITKSYQETVRGLLEGSYYVDYISTSYAVDNPFYGALIRGFAENSSYDIIHFNHGLHGIHMDKETYQNGVESLLNELKNEHITIMLATSTIVKEAGNEALSEAWTEKVTERNEALCELGKKYGYRIDDLFCASAEIPNDLRADDGIHYKNPGARLLGKQVAEFILNRG